MHNAVSERDDLTQKSDNINKKIAISTLSDRGGSTNRDLLSQNPKVARYQLRHTQIPTGAPLAPFVLRYYTTPRGVCQERKTKKITVTESVKFFARSLRKNGFWIAVRANLPIENAGKGEFYIHFTYKLLGMNRIFM